MIGIIKNKRSLLICFLFLLTGGIVSAWLKNELTYDYLLYHYYNGFAFVNARHGIDLMVSGLPASYNPLLDALSYLSIRYSGDDIDLYCFIAGLPFGLLMFIFFKICLLFFDITTVKGKLQIAAAVLIAATGVNIFTLIGAISHDVFSSVFVLAAFYFLTRNDKNFFISGFLLGTGAALKLAMVIYCISGGLTLLLMYKKLPSPLKNISFFVLGGFIGFMLFNGFWMYFLWENYQNPFFPFWNAVFKSPYYPPVNYADRLVLQNMKWIDFILLPFYMINHSYFSGVAAHIDVKDSRLACLFIIAASFVIRFLKTKKALSPAMSFLSVLMLISYIVWIFLSALTRFIIPIEMFAAIAIVSCFSQIEYPQNPFLRSIHWLSAIILLFYFCTAPARSGYWGIRASNKILNENVILPENTLIFGVNEFAPCVIAYLIEKNPSAKAIGDYERWGLYNNGKLAQRKEQMLKEHKNQIAIITKSDTLLFSPVHKGNFSQDWLCKQLSTPKDYTTNSAKFKLCYPPEMKDKIIIEKN